MSLHGLAVRACAVVSTKTSIKVIAKIVKVKVVNTVQVRESVNASLEVKRVLEDSFVSPLFMKEMEVIQSSRGGG